MASVRQGREEVDGGAVDAQLEVEVRAGGVAGVAARADLLPLRELLPLPHVKRLQVRIERLGAVVRA